MKYLNRGLVLAAGLVASASAMAQADDFSVAKGKIESLLGMKVKAIGDAPINGLLQIVTDKGLFYASTDAKYFMQGRIYNLDEGMRNETEISLSAMRLEGIEKFGASMIEFKAKNEKYVVDVFTDITCGYCKKLHSEMDQYNKLGITVRYLAFPRSGLNSKTFTDMVSVWCAENPQKAMTNAKGGDGVTSKTCDNKIAEQYAFGQSIGVNGTPNIILPDGSLIGGYQPPAMLAEALKQIL
jgi:thiol:disulfide interchange protein DsbC